MLRRFVHFLPVLFFFLNTIPCYSLTPVIGKSSETILGLGRLAQSVYSSDGKYVVSCGYAGAFLWDAKSGTMIRAFIGHADTVTSVALSPDGSKLLSGSSDHTAKLWNVTTGQEIRTFSGHTDTITSVAFSRGWIKSADG